MKRLPRTIMMAAITLCGTVGGFSGCLAQEARDSCIVTFLDGHLAGECIIDVDLPDGFGLGG